MKYSGKNREAELTRSAADQSLLDQGERYYVGAKATRGGEPCDFRTSPSPSQEATERAAGSAATIPIQPQEAGDQNGQDAYP
jgi:hypothetical protein